MRLLLFLAFLVIIVISCKPKHENTRAFYFWKTTYDLNQNDKALLDSLDIQDFYVRCFDVDLSNSYHQPVPVGMISYDEPIIDTSLHLNIIPTIFIVNRVFMFTPEEHYKVLAARILQRIPFPDSTYQEVQLDCDWTQFTRERYFKFLRIFKQQLGEKKLSVTIRLHQYRDRDSSGVPPVDRGMLMCYNVASPKSKTTNNSILDSKIVGQYLKGKDYYFPLDIALPLFHWGNWTRRGEFQGLISGWDIEDTLDQNTYKSIGHHTFRVQKDTVIRLNYLREGDEIRLEGAFDNEIEATIDLIKKNVALKNSRIAFFDWDAKKIQQHHEANLEKYYNRLH